MLDIKKLHEDILNKTKSIPLAEVGMEMDGKDRIKDVVEDRQRGVLPSTDEQKNAGNPFDWIPAGMG